jgi:hypothetical protein
VVRFVETLPVKLVLACLVGYALFACSVEETGTSADKGAMGSSVGDTGVFGSVAVTMEAQASASTVPAGAGPGEVVDGWEVNYSKVLVAVGEFRAELITPGGADHTIGDARVQIVDLTGIPAEGLVLREYDRVELGVSSQVELALPAADPSAEATSVVGTADLERMVDNGYSIYIEGSIHQEGGLTCTPGEPDDCAPATTVRFAWGLRAGTAHGDCAGFEVADGDLTEVGLRLPGDLWLRTDFSGNRGVLRAQWIADADLDRDGETTLAELDAIAAADLFPADVYDLSRPISPVDTALDFLVAHARAIGRGACRSSMPLPTTSPGPRGITGR